MITQILIFTLTQILLDVYLHSLHVWSLCFCKSLQNLCATPPRILYSNLVTLDKGWLKLFKTCSKKSCSNDNRMMEKTYMEKLMELKVLSLEERRERADMIQTFKIIHEFSDVNPPTWFRKINHDRVTRMANDPLNLEIQNSMTSIRNNFFSLRVPKKGTLSHKKLNS